MSANLASRVSGLESAEYRRAERRLATFREWIEANASPAEWAAFQRWVNSLFVDFEIAGGPYDLSKVSQYGDFDAAVDGPVLEALGGRMPAEVRSSAGLAFAFAELELERWAWVKQT